MLQSMNTLYQDRRAFGAPLLDNQYIHFRLAELHTEVSREKTMHSFVAFRVKTIYITVFQLELVRAATYQAVDQMMAGENVTMLAR